MEAFARERLLERESELARLDAALEQAASGHGRLIAVEAAAGLGKTRLLEAALTRARELDMGALRARGSELERHFPFGVVRQLFESCIAAAHEAGGEQLFEGAAALAKPLFSSVEDVAAPHASDPICPTLHGLYWVLVNLSSAQPLALAVDDVHWADDPSLRFLDFLLPRLAELPVALLVALRPGEPAESGLLNQLLSAPQSLSLHPAPLSSEAAAELIAAALGRGPEPEFAAACQRATAGNPFFLHTLAHELALRGLEPTAVQARQVERLAPRRVSRAVLMRLAAVPAGRALARAAAVLGERAQLREAAALAEIDERTATEAADRLVRAAVLKSAGRLEFVHPIVRQAVYADLGPHERSAQHARAARLLAAHGAPPERVAAQLLATEPARERWVVEALSRAAEEAVGRGAPEAAIRFLRRVLEEPPPADMRAALLHALGSAEVMHGNAAGVQHLRSALDESPPGRAYALIARELAFALLYHGQMEEAVALLEAAIGQLDEGERELALQLEADMATAGRLHPAAYPRVGERLSRLVGQVTGATPGERAVLATLAQQCTIEGRGADEAAALAERALAGGRLIAEQTAASHTVNDALWALIDSDRFELAASACDAALADARRRGSLAAFGALCCFRSQLGYRRGAIPAAEEDAATALEVGERAGSALVQLGLALLVEALIERGQLAVAAEAIERRGLEGEIPNNTVSNFLLAARGRLRVAIGDAGAGTSDLLEVCRREVAWTGRPASTFPPRASAAVALAQRGELKEARRLARDELASARAWGTPRALGIALRTQALVAQGETRTAGLRKAVAVLEGSAAGLEQTRALVDLGAALRRANRRTEAREALTIGLELADRCGARALGERAREELESAGARPRRLSATGVDALTPSERRVAMLAAEGLSNREIAQALFVTLKTVETHLGHAFRKLRVRSRRELPGRLEGGISRDHE